MSVRILFDHVLIQVTDCGLHVHLKYAEIRQKLALLNIAKLSAADRSIEIVVLERT